METAAEDHSSPPSQLHNGLKNRFVRSLGKIGYGGLALVGGLFLLWELAKGIGFVRAPLVAATFRSPNRQHCIQFKGSDWETDKTVIQSVEFERPGFRPFASLPLIVKSGTLFGARWTSNDTVSLYASSDFAFDGGKSGQFTMDDQNGKFVVSIQTVR